MSSGYERYLKKDITIIIIIIIIIIIMSQYETLECCPHYE